MITEKKFNILDGVILGDNSVIENYCLIGVPPRGHEPGEIDTFIMENAHIRSHTVIYAGNRIGMNFQTGNKVNIREFNHIGNDVSIGTMSVIEHHVEIQDKVRIHSQVFVPEYTILEMGAWIGPNVVLTNARYPISPDAKKNLKGPIVKERAKIGANSTILPGVTIGEMALIGAGSVVTCDVDAGAVVAGNPARKIKHISELPY